jgi:hypothetical protein
MRRNAIAADLRSAKYRKRIVASRKHYKRAGPKVRVAAALARSIRPSMSTIPAYTP